MGSRRRPLGPEGANAARRPLLAPQPMGHNGDSDDSSYRGPNKPSCPSDQGNSEKPCVIHGPFYPQS